MKILVAEDDPVVGDAFSEALRARYHTVFRSASVNDTVNRLGDGEVDVGLLDVQLSDGTAWDVLDRIRTPHPPFSVVLASAVETTPPARFSYIPLFRKPLDFDGLQRAIEEAVPFRAPGNEPDEPKRSNWLERVLIADEPRAIASIPISLGLLTLVTLLMIPLRESASGAIGASYTAAVLVIAAYAGMRVGLMSAILAFLAYNFFTVPPYYTLEVASPSGVVSLLAFLIVGAVGAVLIGSARALATRRAADAAMSRLRLRLLSQTMEARSSELIPTITRVVRDALSDGSHLEVLEPEQAVPDWCPPDPATIARFEQRTIETLYENRSCLYLPVDPAGRLLVAAATRFSDLDRRIVSFAASELSEASTRIDLLKAAEASTKLQARDEAKNALLAAVSHDLRTPLASMKVAVTTALEPTLDLSDTQRDRLLHTVDSEVDRLSGMINHLLDLSRLESGSFRLNRDQIDLAQLIHDAVDRVRLASGRQIDVEIEGELSVTGDSVRLLEVVTNLIDNASRYSTPDTPIVVAGRPNNGSIVVSISDLGPGMTPEEKEQLFRPFMRGHRSGEGTGLGLAITRSIVTAHGGSIDVVSSPNAGTTMSVTIPKRAVDG